MNPQHRAHMRLFGDRWADFRTLPCDPQSGQMLLSALREALTRDTAAVYVENPSYLGFIEAQAPEIAELAHEAGALLVVGLDATSLGVLEAPARYGADLACGEVQGLGNRMQYGGGLCGFIASGDAPEFVAQYPTMLVSIAPGSDGEFGSSDRTSFDQREAARDFTGSSQWLCGIIAGVYLALAGPQGMVDLGEAILVNSHFAAQALSTVAGIRVPALTAPWFKEFVVNFDGTGMTVREINRGLLEHGIEGGMDLSREFPWLGQSALYSVTEVHRRCDIERLVEALREVTR
jgi:glycine dehydrogenase subunit 1